MDILKKILEETAFHTLGIVPIDGVTILGDVNKILGALPPDDAKRMRRKFRKLWRKYVKSASSRSQCLESEKMKIGSEAPDRRAKRARKWAVRKMIVNSLETAEKSGNLVKNNDSGI